ncbi:winged helix-turn-helix domain-containing protein [Skermania piniformis]|uniref:Winged helix DNA-binding domain-containing protein n=1 Tax=Skermania pinensis TaxID=39122 RepID=A0ABX8S455_9ACTN|nr:crosslink repair DNA glycosylase YcaQ family protein [Skermania piniformis]QXQ12610.1 winged helix DNA-binding domain-containing protein [Skermania piniformis]
MANLSAAAARRTVLAAQGFGEPAGAVTRRAVNRVLDRLRVVQLDSVSAVVRAHYAPVFARLGRYDRSLLDELVWRDSARRPRRAVEYWAHEAAVIPIADWPLFGWRMAGYADGRWGHARGVQDRRPTLARDVLDVIVERGPCSAGEIERELELADSGRKGPWWGHSDTKVVCEQLFAVGELSVARRVGFTRHYELTERVLPAAVRSRPVGEADAVRALVGHAARALGVATEPDLRDYYRLRRAQTAPAIADLVDAGELEPVTVDGWPDPAYRAVGARTLRRIEGHALLCPFDPLIFDRARTERMFDFHYRIEIYTPAHKRRYGYYVFAFLADDQLVARVDLRAERAAGRLSVPGAFAEPGRADRTTADRLALALRELADWLELDTVVVGERGDLAGLLSRAGG